MAKILRELQPCGTRQAFNRHKKHGGIPCEACVRAMVAALVIRYNVRSAGSGHDDYYLVKVKQELFERYGVVES